jgi:predicted HNH restriction endonuclease
MKTIFLTFVATLLFLLSCENKKAVIPITKPKSNQESIKQKTLEYNRQYYAYEKKAIDTLIAINNWSFEESKTGLRYQIEHNADCNPTKFPKKANRVVIDITIQDIHQKTIYPWQEQTVWYLKDYNVNGLIEALSKMCVGSKAKIIVPSHLGYGKIGDRDSISPNQVLIYSIKVKQIH